MQEIKERRAREIAGVDYELDPMCVNCILNHVEKEGKKFRVPCTPIRKDAIDQDHNLSEREYALYKIISDHDIFAVSQLDMVLRNFQSEILKCTSKRKVLRLPRRAGKTVVMATLAITFALKHPNAKVLVAAPYVVQIEVIFKQMNDFIKKSDLLMSAVNRGSTSKHKLYKSNPHLFTFSNGSEIVGLTTGAQEAANIRGQSADLIILDEVDYMNDGDIEAILPILATSPDTVFVAASTPAGRKSYFYEWCHSDSYKHVHYVYQELEHYNPQQDEEFKETYPLERYEREILAEFTLQEAGVYRPDFIERAIMEYRYDDLQMVNDGIYTFGVDWNESAGVHIVVCKLDRIGGKITATNVIIVPPSKLTQIVAVERILELDSVYRPKKIMLDAGYGNTQYQMMLQIAHDHPERKLEQRLEMIPFQSNIELYDPVNGGVTTQPVKPVMVSISVRFLEEDKIILPASEDYPSKLIGQMRNYVIEGYGAKGVPNYTKGYVHTLEAWQLAVFGMWKLYSKDLMENVVSEKLIKARKKEPANVMYGTRRRFARDRGFLKEYSFGKRRRFLV